MKSPSQWVKGFLVAMLFAAVFGVVSVARAADLPLAAASPLTGVSFDDRPLLLPVQRNFQMAMLTASSELGRSCGKMEAYGWRMSQTEQGRVNQIFNNTVDRMRLRGFDITPQTLSSVSNDITLFTADKSNKHYLFLWSAGELGLVMTLCETSAPLTKTVRTSHAPIAPSVQVFPVDIVTSKLDAPRKTQTAPGGSFSPAGEWKGSYSCAQGQTGGTLQITHVSGEDFEGVFKFYGTARNPNVPSGAYTIFGQYDKASKRTLINPGKWIKHPSSYYNTVIVGSFDPSNDTFSGLFQGIEGCTSFEARREGPAVHDAATKKVTKKKAVKKSAKKAPKKKVTKKQEFETLDLPPLAPAVPAIPALPAKPDVPAGIQLGAPQ